jgi:predicted HAD superfamily Cof-like phosphohydrolase
MTNPTELVREFHEAFGVTSGEGTRALRADLIREEALEVLDALAIGSRAEIAKELADLVVVTYGTAIALGIDLDKALELVHASNMSKLDDNGRPVMRADGKVLKSDNYLPPVMDAAVLEVKP